MVEKGVVFGRFQLLHLKHMEYILAAKMRCKKLYIGITHSDITMFGAASKLDKNGSAKCDNPMTYLERVEMIRSAIEVFGITKEDYEIIPFPITHPGLIEQYAPKDATYYMSICSEWDEEQEKILKDLGLKVEVLMRKKPEEVMVSGSKIRQLMTEEKEWKQHVPKAVGQYVTEHEIDKRVLLLNSIAEVEEEKEESDE